MKKILALIPFLLLSGVANAESVDQQITVGKYNTFVFDKPYKALVFEPGSAIDEPIPLSGNNGFLLRPKSGAKKPFQLIVELKNGETVQFKLEPESEAAEGTVYRRNGAGIYAAPEGQRARPSDKWIADTMQSAVLHQIPVGFMDEGKPKFAQLGDTSLLPIKRFSNNQYELLVYEVRSETAKEIQPRDFWHEGVEGVQLEGDVVSATERPTLFVLREIKAND